jgi:hypothetical protein
MPIRIFLAARVFIGRPAARPRPPYDEEEQRKRNSRFQQQEHQTIHGEAGPTFSEEV